MIVCFQHVVALSLAELEKALECSKTKLERPRIEFKTDFSCDEANCRNLANSGQRCREVGRAKLELGLADLAKPPPSSVRPFV